MIGRRRNKPVVSRARGPEQRFYIIQRHTVQKGCDGPYGDGGDCKLRAVVTVHGPDIPIRNLCSLCLIEFFWHFGYCDAKITIVP